MGNWKELGEVPDSDEEDFDSQDSQEAGVASDTVPSHLAPEDLSSEAADDVWSIQSSSSELREYEEKLARKRAAVAISAEAAAATSIPHSSKSDAGQAPEKHGSTQRIPEPQNGLLSTGPQEPPGRSPLSQLYEKPPELHEMTTEPSSTDDVRLNRSLRPRKPIQEHPYLLENAHYSHFMKSHGIRPIRVNVPSQEVVRQEEEDSQDKEFVSETSQLTAANPLLGVSDESQPTAHDDRYDIDELALSPSPRTSSPQRRLAASSQPSHDDQTDSTSLLGDEDLPTLDDLAHHNYIVPARGAKRRRASRPSSPRKRLKIHPSFWDMSSSPDSSPANQQGSSPKMRLSAIPPSLHDSRPILGSSRKNPRTSTKSDSPTAVIDMVSTGGESDSEDENSAPGQESLSDSDSEVVRRNGRRIRGVLPASWLRLNQRDSRGAMGRTSSHRKSPVPDPSQAPRKGLAVVRRVSPTAFETSAAFFNELYDRDDNDTLDSQLLETDRVTANEVAFGRMQDDGESVVEEDVIDRMTPARKRVNSSTPGNTSATKQRREHHNMFKELPKKRPRQQKVSDLLIDTKTSTSSSIGKIMGKAARRLSSQVCQQPIRPAKPPLLSIIDMAGSDPPQFIKIAARTARRRRDLGKSSPSKKLINLGNRRDNIDALSVLGDWRSGHIKPTVAHVAPRPKSFQGEIPDARQPLQPVSSNPRAGSTKHTWRLPFVQPRKLAKQSSITGFVTTALDGPAIDVAQSSQPTSRPVVRSLSRKTTESYRPAQLEIVEQDSSDQAGFIARKRALDALYRKLRRDAPSQSVRLQNLLSGNHLISPNDWKAVANSRTPTDDEQGRQRLGFRKRYSPKRLDIAAAQFVHANDPLPNFKNTVPAGEGDLSQGGRLHGLGQFGTHYTHHFDIFPLDAGVYFHESTLVGSGALIETVDNNYTEKLRHVRPGVSFNFGEQHLRWGVWEDTTSSEMGVLFDWLLDQLKETDEHDQAANFSTIVAASDFIFHYVLRSLSFSEESNGKSFIKRMTELVVAFTARLPTTTMQREIYAINPRTRAYLDVQLRVVLVAFLLLRICQGSPAYTCEAVRSEQILQELVKVTIDRLLQIGLDDIRSAYDDLQLLRIRESGIRNDRLALNCWVLIMRVLENAHIPRGGFWDLTYSSMAPSAAVEGYDAQRFENMWRSIFTLLPLCEFDDSGVLVPGLRRSLPMHGWALPQQLLKRVFEVYRAYPRQSPSFNDYCRAIVGRCHYLIQQWGWYRCTGILGTIFDFFGSRNLAHLRNEEVYKSPRFLEDLAGVPSLSIEAEDRCFHIFLKMLAVVIKRFRDLGLSKDIRNLVARTLPNHNRQYSKEQVIHQHDLAALRNHHDLLCTLFWSAPPEFRPAVHVLEKLVQPGTSHKEACLINLRAWNQLARFVVSTGESSESYRPLTHWQSNMFQTTLDQYLSAADDIQQQFLALSKDVSSGISQDMINNMISKNKAAAMDILHFSVKASLDVMKHSSSLHVASYSLNMGLLEKVFSKLDAAPGDFDWGVFRAAIETLDHYASLVENAFDEQYSSNMDCSLNPEHTEEAVLLLDQKLASSLFSVTRNALVFSGASISSETNDQATCVEKAVMLCARVASRFIHSGLARVLHFFKPGKYGLFENPPSKLDASERKHLTLFVALLVKNNVFDFRELDTTVFELWMTSVVRPLQSVAYEGYLAEVLKQHNFPYMQDVLVPPGARPDYNLERTFFSSGLSYIRKSVRNADSNQKKPLRSDFAKLLRSVMDQMKRSLRDLVPDPVNHHPYVSFVREIVALVKTYGADICPVDPFYYQPSQEYAPSVEDPQLHTAGIVAYGVRLGEGETTAAPQLFYYLYNNFKTAMVNGLLNDECKILENSLSNSSVLGFAIGQMLPAIIRATSQAIDAWLLLDVYCIALNRLFRRSCVPKEFQGEEMENVADLIGSILDLIKDKRESSSMTSRISRAEVNVLTLSMGLCNLLRKTLISWSIQPSTIQSRRLVGLIEEVTGFTKEGLAYLDKTFNSVDGGITLADIYVKDLLDGVLPCDPNKPVMYSAKSPHVDSFSKHIAEDIRKNWVVTEDTVTVNVPVRAHGASATQSGQGTRHELGSDRELLGDLHQELRLWVAEMGRNLERCSRRRVWKSSDSLVF